MTAFNGLPERLYRVKRGTFWLKRFTVAHAGATRHIDHAWSKKEADGILFSYGNAEAAIAQIGASWAFKIVEADL